MRNRFSRRNFLKFLGWGAGAAAVGASGVGRLVHAAEPAEKSSLRNLAGPDPFSLPRRTLGRTGVQVSRLGIGMAALQSYPKNEAEEVMGAVLDTGINYFDAAPTYGNVQIKMGDFVKAHRDEMFLVSKVEAQNYAGVLGQIEKSLQDLKTDHIDLVHIHNLGDFHLERCLRDDDVLGALKAARKAGKIRFIGCSGHLLPMKFVTALNTGEMDVMMVAMNFVDRFTYDFEGKVLPTARRHHTGIVAMKVLGGSNDMRYDRTSVARIPSELHDSAIRYALGLPECAVAVIGIKSREQLKTAAQSVKNFKPLSDVERASLFEQGRQLAKTWGTHFGPVA